MKIAIPICSERIAAAMASRNAASSKSLLISVTALRLATVLDFAHDFILFESDQDRVTRRTKVKLPEVRQLANLGVEVLICGALSHPLATLFVNAGIEIIPLVSGPVEEVLASYLQGNLKDADFLFPGCAPGEREQWRARHRR